MGGGSDSVCEALGVSRGGFYAWLTRSRSQRSRSDEELGAKVRTSFVASDRTYGARRVWKDMLAEGLSCGLPSRCQGGRSGFPGPHSIGFPASTTRTVAVGRQCSQPGTPSAQACRSRWRTGTSPWWRSRQGRGAKPDGEAPPGAGEGGHVVDLGAAGDARQRRQGAPGTA